MTNGNPFIQRGMIREPVAFAGRWGELSLLFHSLEQRRPVFVVGTPGVGKSSLLWHVMQAAALNLERFDLRAFYLDLAVAGSEADVYRTVITALGQRGESLLGLEKALAETDGPVLLCLDNVDTPLPWMEAMLDALVRLVRRGQLMLVAAQDGRPPILSERLALVQLGAFASTEVRLLTDAYLEGTGVTFTSRNQRQIVRLSQSHPAYVQRAAFHLYRAKLDPTYAWVRAFLEEAREVPIPGAPLPPAVFDSADDTAFYADLDDDAGVPETPPPPTFELEESAGVWWVALPLLAGVLAGLASQQFWLGLVVAVVLALLVAFWRRKAELPNRRTEEPQN